MVQFFRDNGYYIIRMAATQIAMTVFGLILSAATYAHNGIFIFSSVLAVCMYLWLLYTLCWEVGIKDKVRLDGGRIAYRPLRMLPASLVANAVNLVLAFLSVVGCLFVRDIANASPMWAATLYKVPHDFLLFIHSMYGGIIESVLPNGQHPLLNAVLYLVSIAPALFFTSFGYYMGIHNRSIGSFFGIKPRFDRR